MRLSAFNVYVADFPDPGLTLIYNTFSGGFVSVDAMTIAALRKADAGQRLDAAEAALVDPELLDEDVGVLVESRGAEERAYLEHYRQWKDDPRRLDCMVSTSLACNLDCTYCCQADVLNGKTLSVDLAAHTAAWIADRARDIGVAEIRLRFVGGEPLLH